MRSKKTFLLAVIILTLTSAANADLVLTLNGLDTTEGYAHIEGKNNLVIAVAGDTEVDPNSYHIEAVGGVLQANPNTVSPENYSFTFEDESMLGIVRLIVNNDMVIDGTSVKEGDMIYDLFLVYISETDTVISCGVNLETIISSQLVPEPEPEPQPEPEPELQPETQSQSEPAPEPQPVPELNPEPELAEVTAEPRSASALKAPPYFGAESERGTRSRKFRTLTRQAIEKMSKLEYFPEASSPASPYTTGAGEASGEGGDEEGGMGMFTMMGEGGGDYVNIPAGPLTENTIWDSNVVLLGCVEVNNVMLVIKPGVEVRITNGEEGGIIVRNNGCLIANGTPDEMINFFPTSTEDPRYNYAIKLEETASPLCEISYCTIYYAETGIWSENKRLETPIHDNSIWSCTAGIGQDGPMLTDVINNEVINAIEVGIGANLADVNDTASNINEILIENNTIVGWYDAGMGQDFGIYISGVEDPNDAGTVIMANNLIVTSWVSAICQTGGWIRSCVVCNGFYGNGSIYYEGIGGGGSGEYMRDPNSVIVEDFNTPYDASYPDRLRDTWKDRWTQLPKTGATVSPDQTTVLSGQSMMYVYENFEFAEGYSSYYSEAEANTLELPSGIGKNWTSYDVNTLTLYFYGQLGNDIGEQMYVKLTDGDQEDFYVIDNFDSYDSATDMRAVWKDYWTQPAPRTGATVSADQNMVRSVQSMRYLYENQYEPYYSEANATIGTETGELNIEPNWLGLGAQTLSLWFYGTATNDANQQMYIKLIDGGGVSEKVDYPDMNDIREPNWHQWNILLTDFTDVNLADVNKIIIGFGDGTQAENDDIEDVVFFEDIRLYTEYPPRPHMVKVAYNGSPYRLIEEWWHVWNIPFTELNDVNLANVKSIAIGFGDGNAPYVSTGTGTVYFDEIVLRDGPAEEPFDDGAVELDEDPFVNGYDDYPLFLKPGCSLIEAGAGYIDEYPYLLGKASCAYRIPDTNNLHGIPDTNWANIGFHYFDWSYSNAGGDGNLMPADLSGDKIVNLVDFAVFANYWQQSTSEKNDVDRSGFVDYNDLYIMAAEWLKTININPPIEVNIFGDANNGFAEVGADGYSSDTQRIFLLADGQYTGEISGFRGGWPLGVDVSKFDGGEHQFKAIGIDSNCLVTCSNVTNNEFACPLNYCLLPSHYEPNEPLCFSAFNPSVGDVTVNVYADCNNLVWSQTYSGDSILGSIPAEITDQNEIDYVSFDKSGGESIIKICSASPADPTEPPFDVQALIIAPDFLLRLKGKTTIQAVQKAFENRGIKYIKLSGGDACYELISSYAKTNPIKYMYILAHGDYVVGYALRTAVQLSDGWAVSMKLTDPDGAPSWCEFLGSYWEERAKSFATMGFTTLEFVYSDACYGGRLVVKENRLTIGQPGFFGNLPPDEGLVSDMSLALGLHTDIFANRGYEGWYDYGEFRIWPETNCQKWAKDMWWRLGAGDTIGEALMVAISEQPGSSDPNAPINSFRFRGQGEIDNISLVGN